MTEKKETVTKDKATKEKNIPSRITSRDLMAAIFESFGPEGNEEKKKKMKQKICDYLKQSAHECEVYKKYNILILYDSSIMVKGDADNIYNAVTNFTEKKPLLLILYSTGGIIGSAYLIGQLCREYSQEAFIISVPRHAKSAATLLCCSADEIHMGSLSELGPIDPQINNLPALGLKNSIEHIANLVKETPESAEMFARYLHYSLKPVDLGYYERIAESAIQ
jgi:ClpP class serine protease